MSEGDRMILDAAYEVYWKACSNWGGTRIRGVAYPFGLPPAMPEHRWRVSWDVMRALTEAAPPPHPVPNPKFSVGAVRTLLGFPVDVDPDAPAGTLTLCEVIRMDALCAALAASPTASHGPEPERG